MMRSMYAGVSGLKNHQTKMDVIGNNIANVNTAGFKKSRVVFQDTLYQNIQGASRPTDARGGTNPMAIGLGMTISSIDQIHTPSPASTTNKATDLAVNGNGYFVVSNGGQQFYTRAGNFDFDQMGNLVQTSNGFKVMGWMADKTQVDDAGNWKIDTTKACQPVDISTFKTVEPTATTEMQFTGNLSSKLGNHDLSAGFTLASSVPNENDCVVTSKEVYDELGNKQVVYFRFFKTIDDPSAADPQIKWHCDVSLDPDFSGTISIDPNAGVSGVLRIQNMITFTPEGTVDQAHSMQDLKLIIDRSSYGTNDIEFDVDINQLTQWETKSTAWAEYQNGYSMGNLTSFTIGIDGTIQGVYDNGESRNLARVALANFQNPSGLIQTGNSLFQVSNNSGDALIGGPGDQGMGSVLPGRLEMSNVDLSEEFTDMIITQRGFQANSRIITTSDEMLQELVNLKR